MLTFEERIPTTLSPSHVWDLLAQSFLDSSQSPLWPNDMEELKAKSFKRGERVQATYKLGPVGATQHYRLSECDPATHTLVYRAEADHPLSGGGEVTLEPYGERGTVIVWRGAYGKKPSLRSLGAAFFTERVFVPRFFEALTTNLRMLERAMALAEKHMENAPPYTHPKRRVG